VTSSFVERVMAQATAYRAAPQMSVSTSFEACYRQHWARVYRWSLRYGSGNASWAEDLAHDVFVKLLERLPSLDNPDDVGGWLRRTTANLAIDRLRRQRSWTS